MAASKKNALKDLSFEYKKDLLCAFRENMNTASSHYGPIFRKMKLLDAIDQNRLWEALGAKFPAYQILPNTNYISYVKENLVASIYSITKGASIVSTSEEDIEPIANLNVALEHIWDRQKIGTKQLEAGTSAALFNLGITEVGWSTHADDGKGSVALKNIHPLQFMRDPFAESLDTAAYCVTWEHLHKQTILRNPDYKESFEEFLKSGGGQVSTISFDSSDVQRFIFRPNPTSATDYYTVHRYYFRTLSPSGEPVTSVIHVLNEDHILFYQAEIKPNNYPFVECFCNLPEGDIIGTSPCAKIMENSIAYNVLLSCLLTAEYRNQRPPKFINSASGLNIRTFAEYGNDADYTFIVQGDASRAVHYHEFPSPSALAPGLNAALTNDIEKISGVDDRYTGRDTGSVLTTGGIQDMLSRVTLIDTTKIKNYEDYSERLTRQILSQLVEFGGKREYVKKDAITGKYQKIEVKYTSLQNPAFLSYAIDISSEMPKNKQRLAATANMLMEKQMQYSQAGNSVELLTPEEWLNMQDLPNKEYMLRRMNIQRLQDATQDVLDTITSFGSLVATGVPPEEATAITAQNKAAVRQGKEPEIPIPNIEDVMSMAASSAPEVAQAPVVEEDFSSLIQEPVQGVDDIAMLLNNQEEFLV